MDKERVTVNKARMTFRFESEPSREKRPEYRGAADVTGSLQLPAERQETVEEGTSGPNRVILFERHPRAPEPPLPVIPDFPEWQDPLGSAIQPWSTHSAVPVRQNPGDHDESEVLDADWQTDREYQWNEQYRAGWEQNSGSGHERPRKPGSSWKLAGSVASALVTGALFGYVILSFFNNPPSVPHTGTEAAVPAAATVDPSAGTETGAGGDSRDDTLPVVQAGVPSQTFYVLQYGLFSSEARAKDAVNELQAQGITAAVDVKEQNRVYAGLATEREQAKTISSLLGTKGIGLYVRELELPALDKAAFAGDSRMLTSYFEQSTAMVNELSTVSADLIGQAEPAQLTAEQTARINALHEGWTQTFRQLKSALPAEGQIAAVNLEKSMNTGLSAWDEYSKNASVTYLWDIQSAMIEYLLQQKNLIAALER
ncbi:SPOR domain-containing protein [Paenibacillus sp. JX-17]|uniref:SPOR domain-containing protein n=1 Tax=Paenibacillus lacisoli TaxID=3064525 RepID=A0ABT9CC97_9BACL|nr:SPOR domain-containing protein [Paenibacillus sp. JX-17]MDO7906890.1 SPOR domain-containing protein [Paenibacillus sp. JX-17]